MKKRLPYALAFLLILGLLAQGIYIHYRSKYPYGYTHRCSKILSSMLIDYAQAHGGQYPRADDDNQLGLEKAIKNQPVHLDLVVGKAGDLEKAEQFYHANGFLLKEHSSWHFVSGLTTADEGEPPATSPDRGPESNGKL